MNCCSSNNCAETGLFFSQYSRRSEKLFLKKGLEKVQRHLLEGVEHHPIQGKKILDIGCGVGALHLKLLERGASHATGVDASEGMLETAKGLSQRLGLREKTSYLLGDFVGLADSLEEVEITLLDKVVCCYEDLDQLIEKSAMKTTEIYALSHPRNNFLVKTSFMILIALRKLFSSGFRPFWHDWNRMHDRIGHQGFRLVYERPTFLWNVAVFQRV